MEMNDEIGQEVLEKLNTLIRLISLSLLEDIEVKEKIKKERILKELFPVLLDTDKKRMVYEMTDGKNSRREIAKALRISSATLTKWWKQWYSYAILTREKRKYRRIVSKKDDVRKKGRTPIPRRIHIPPDNEILDICRHGEDQLYEFKSPGTIAHKITKEVAAFVHTKNGGIVFYGVDDDGSIIGSDIRLQEFDQRIQNSIRNTISPQPKVKIKRRKVMGSTIFLVVILPWDRETVYQYTKDEKYYIRKGTNIFALKPEEIKQLSRGESLT